MPKACGSLRVVDEEARDELERLERDRVRLLVAGDVEEVSALHADDFELITPKGGALTKGEYLDAVSTGDIHYVRWEPAEIEVRLYGTAAVLRCQAEMEMPGFVARLWHTDLYERRDGRWQIVWSQATRLAE